MVSRLSYVYCLHDLFTISEATVKMIGLRQHYFTAAWNLFDFVLVIASIVGILMEEINGSNLETSNAFLSSLLQYISNNRGYGFLILICFP